MSHLHDEVQKRLSTLNLNKRDQDDVVAEIADHLEFAAAELADSGLAPDVALAQVLKQAGDWRSLRKGIQRSKERSMKERVQKMWLPGLATGFIAYAAQNVIGHRVAWPRVVHISDAYLVYSWQWLLVLLFTGALGAAWSRLAGGTVRDRLVSALAPSEIMALLIIGAFPFDMIIQIAVDHRVPYAITHPLTIVALVSWLVVIPAVPSLLGAAWFLAEEGRGAARLNPEPPARA